MTTMADCNPIIWLDQLIELKINIMQILDIYLNIDR